MDWSNLGLWMFLPILVTLIVLALWARRAAKGDEATERMARHHRVFAPAVQEARRKKEEK